MRRLLVLVIVAAVGLAGFEVARDPAQIRTILAIELTTALVFVTLRKPEAAVLIVLAFLPGLGLLRRVLIPIAGWSAHDPLLLVAPIVSIVMVHRLFIIERRSLAKDAISKLVLALLVVALVETINPAGGGLLAGLTGLLFMAAPLLWFFIGRDLTDRRRISILLVCAAGTGAVTAAYGLIQQSVGFPSWDASWISIGGYAALNVGGATRAFGTMSSSAEYATLVAMALVIAVAGILFMPRRWLLATPLVPLLASALFLDSSRGIVILLFVALVVMLSLRTGHVVLAGLVAGVATVAIVSGVTSYGSQLTGIADSSGNPFIAHQVSGLMNPFDPQVSTYSSHEQLVVSGFITSLHNPLGLGTAVTNQAGSKLAAAPAGTEVDITDAFVALGLPGGLLFSVIVLLVLWRIGRFGLESRDAVALATVGVLSVALGQWLNGGYYAVAPLVWTVIGWANREWLYRKKSRDLNHQRGLVIEKQQLASQPASR